MSEVRYLLKFGEEKHIEELVNGSLFCSSAETFWGIEKDKQIKGQCDVLEAGSRMFAQRMILQEYGSGNVTAFNRKANVLVHFDPAKKVPVFCLTAVFDSDCQIDKEGNCSICLSTETKKAIREHFPHADTVAIIDCPQQFIQDIVSSIGCRIESGPVQYFNIDKGFDTEDGQVAMDLEYMKYLTQDVPPIREGGNLKYSFQAEYVYRVLFCKDVFFKPEQEYRIVLPNDSIYEGTHYPVSFSRGMRTMPLEEFLK